MAKTTAKPRGDGRVWSDELLLFVHPNRMPWKKATPSPYELTDSDGWPALDADIIAASTTTRQP